MHHPPTTARRPGRGTAIAVAGALTAVLLAPPAPAGAAVTAGPVTARVSVGTDGGQISAPGKVGNRVLIDGDGRHVLFETSAKLVAGDDNGKLDIYDRDLRAATTTLVTRAADGTSLLPGDADACGASSDLRFVAFLANAPGTTGAGDLQVWLLDRDTGSAAVVSLTSSEVRSGVPGNSGIVASGACPVSDDGRYVAFVSSASNLSPNGFAQVFRRDRTAGTTAIVSMSTASVVANDDATQPTMTDDGNQIAFQADAANLVAGDTNGHTDVFVRTMSAATTIRASLRDDDTQIADHASNEGAIAGDGRYVAFASDGVGITPGEEGTSFDVYVRDLSTASTELVSKSSAGAQAEGISVSPAISDDGRFVAFKSTAPNLYPAKPDSTVLDTFLRDRTVGSTALASRTSGIASGDGTSQRISVADDGGAVAFVSQAKNLVRNDTNGQVDVFVRQFALDRAPFGSYDALVAQQFHDFAGRAPTASEVTEWRARLVNGEQSPDSTILTLAHSTAFAGKRAPLIRLYWAFFLRAPDKGGLDYWTGRLSAGASLASVAKQFATSSEFQAKYGALSNAEFVTKIYQNIFDRDPDAGGLAYWTNKLDAKQKTRGDVMVNFSESSEGKRRLAPQTDTVLLYLGMLRRMPHQDELGEAMAHIVLGGVAVDVASYLREKAAYAARVTP